jgi:hypothetical protein
MYSSKTGGLTIARFAKYLPPVTLQALVYMWHTDALDMFDDYLGELSNFFDTTNQSPTGGEDNWITSITIKHWRLQDDIESTVRRIERGVDENELRKRQKRRDAKERDDRNKKGIVEEIQPESDFPPRSVADSRKAAEELDGMIRHPSKIHELAMSLAITGDEKGRSWTCSIVCELFDEKAVSGYMAEAARILQMFIHQQHAGRVLVFLLILGHMCEKLAEECDWFMRELDGIMEMNVSLYPFPSQNLPSCFDPLANRVCTARAAEGSTGRHGVAQVRLGAEEAEADALGPRGAEGIQRSTYKGSRRNSNGRDFDDDIPQQEGEYFRPGYHPARLNWRVTRGFNPVG